MYANVTVDFCLTLKSHRLSVVLTGAVTTENIHTHNTDFNLRAMSSRKISLPFHRFIVTAFCRTTVGDCEQAFDV